MGYQQALGVFLGDSCACIGDSVRATSVGYLGTALDTTDHSRSVVGDHSFVFGVGTRSCCTQPGADDNEKE
jgi:hypothetical protein